MKPWQMMRRFGPAAGGGGGPSNPYWANTVLQLHYEGGTIVDSSASPKSLVLNSPGSLSSAHAKFGGQSFAGTGSGSYIAVGPDPALSLGTGDFTFDTWVCANSVSAGLQMLWDTRSRSTGGNGIVLYLAGANLRYGDSGGGRNTSFNLSVAVDTHLEITRVSGVIYVFADGSTVLTDTNTTNYSNNEHFIGAATYTPVGAAAFDGFFDETRIIIGEGVHTSGFTPPTAPYPDGP